MINPPTDPLIGSTVSQYTIVAKLGGGGMGVVYRATDSKLGRTVALKFLPPQWSHDEGAKQRFLREAQAASATNHPNICVIHDIEHTDDGRLFIVMAYYEGQTLKQKLEGGALPLFEALEIASGVAEGLAKAHAQGVVHRDIKPGNLIVTDDGVKILDFGLAKFANALQLTIQGSTIGTLAYMSPEQARGEEADARSDVWALGVVLYQMLTGDVPFKGSYEEAVFYAIKNEPVPPLRVTGGQIPEALEALVLRALEKDPGKRYQGAREMALDLRVLQGRTVPVDLLTGPLPPLPAREPLSRWQRMRRTVTLARAVATLVVLVALAAGSYWWLTRPVVRILIAIAPVANYTGESELDPYRLALTESLTEELGQAPNIRVVSYRRLIEIIRRFIGTPDVAGSEAVQAIAANSGARLIIIPTLINRGGSWQATADVRGAETGTTVAKYETVALTGSLPKDTADRLALLLAARIQQHFGPGGILDAVMAFFRADLTLRWRLHDLVYGRKSPVARFRTLDAARAFEQGLNNYDQLEYSEALKAFRQASSLDAQNPMTHAWLSRALLILYSRNDAIASAQRAKQLLTADTPKSDAVFIEGVFAESQKDFDRAEERYRQFATLANDDPWAYTELADYLRRRDRSQEAVEAYHGVLRLDPGYIRPHVELCQLYAAGLGNLPLAEQNAQTALKSYRAGGNPLGEAQALLCLAEAQRRQAGTGVPEIRRSVAEARRIFESYGHLYNVSRACQYQGLVENADGNFRDAARFFEEAVSRSREVGNRPIEGLALMNLGTMSVDLGQQSEALAYYKRARDVFEEMSDERRAAEMAINAAGLQINYGTDQKDALSRLTTARATVEKLGDVDFHALAMQVGAASLRNAGRLKEARREFVAALELARGKQLSKRSTSLRVRIAESDFLMNDYEIARKSLEELLAPDTDRRNLEARALLGRVLTRLGDVDAATRYLEAASTDIDAQRLPEFAPIVNTALGALAFEWNKSQEARAHFEKAAGLGGDLPDAASVEARSYLGLIDQAAGRDQAARQKVMASVQQAKKMGRLALEAECRVHLARVHFQQRGYREAIEALRGVPPENGEPTIGPELYAQVHYWRGRALAGLGDQRTANEELVQARRLVERLRASFGDRFASRPDIRSMLEPSTVRQHD